MLPRYPRLKTGRQIPAAAINRSLADLQSLMIPSFQSAGLQAKVTPFGTYIDDPNHKPFLALIQGMYGGSQIGGSAYQGGTGDGSGSNYLPATDQDNAYDWVEAVWISQNNDLVVVEKPNARYGTIEERPALEANGGNDVPEGTVVWLYPGWGAPDFYFFFDPGISASGSGGRTYTVTCNEDGTVSVE